MRHKLWSPDWNLAPVNHSCHYFPHCYINTILPALVLNIGTKHKSWGVDLSNMDVISSETCSAYCILWLQLWASLSKMFCSCCVFKNPVLIRPQSQSAQWDFSMLVHWCKKNWKLPIFLHQWTNHHVTFYTAGNIKKAEEKHEETPLCLGPCRGTCW